MQTQEQNGVFTVSELTFCIKGLLENNFKSIIVQGEVSNYKLQSSGHIYFSLKDKESQIAVAFFKMSARLLSRPIKDGDQILIKGEINVYPPRGNYQIIAREISFVGLGELLLKLHELKEKLKAKGWFDQAIKKQLPFLPKKIGVVTSPTGAVIQDIINILNRRYKNFHLILNPVKVQGDGAASEIAQAINDFNTYNLVDVIIVGRGGGSLEDLWPFNEEIVAKAIFESKIPIISAVGHETDVSISDLVADVRAPTPSAAAELVLPQKELILNTLKNYHNQIGKNVYLQTQNYKKLVNNFSKNSFLSSSTALLARKMQHLDDFKNELENTILFRLENQKNSLKSMQEKISLLSPTNQIKILKERLDMLSKRLTESIKKQFLFNKDKFLRSVSHLRSIDPKNLLKKGYSILFSQKKNSIILSSTEVVKNDEISIVLHDGKIFATINEIELKNDK
ncbi:MAG: exodeoxyribonuclease VII large subunit [Chlamydiae bacterium]|nr:exodeoxyribonuclease VII large subunit [Chlamydiota bacterium]